MPRTNEFCSLQFQYGGTYLNWYQSYLLLGTVDCWIPLLHGQNSGEMNPYFMEMYTTDLLSSIGEHLEQPITRKLGDNNRPCEHQLTDFFLSSPTLWATSPDFASA